MKVRTSAATVAISVLALMATACSGESEKPADEEVAGPTGGKYDPRLPTYKVAKNVELDSPAVEKAQKAGKIVIGTKNDIPYLGFEDAKGERSGFDIEVAKMVAADLGFAPSQIEFRSVQSSVRESAISKGEVDLYVGTYTITEKRKKQVAFAGPYFMAGADLLVRKNDKTISGPFSLQGKTVCSVKGSTSIQEIQKPDYGTQTVELSKYSECVDQLIGKKVDAVTTDDAILMGFAAQRPSKLRVVGRPFTEEPYGIGMNKTDKVLRGAVSDALEAHDRNGDFDAAYDATLGLSGARWSGPPMLDRY